MKPQFELHGGSKAIRPCGKLLFMERSLHVISDANGDPSSGVCASCNRRFVAKPKPGEDAMHWLTREFNDHDCDDDNSQAAVRIVKEEIRD
jgi:hypothetical protein